MKKYVVVALGLMARENVFARVEPLPKVRKHLQYNYGIKLYNEMSYQESFHTASSQGTAGMFRRTTETTTLLRPTVAFQWRNKRNNFHEIELSRFNIEKDNIENRQFTSNGQYIVLGGGGTVTTNVSVRYEYSIPFCKKKNPRLVPGLGLGINPYYTRQNARPYTSSGFPEANAELGFRTYVVPRLSYHFSKRLYCDVNIPLCLTNFSLQHQNLKDPSLSINQQRYNVINLEVFPKLISARVGLGLKI